MMRFSTTMVLMEGRMMSLKRCHALAPSISAASYSTGSTEAIAPMNMTMFWPMYFQIEQATSTTC